jgi:endonuclease III
METTDKKKWAREVIRRLKKEYPGRGTALHYSNPLELLVATVLSAQSTDRQINQLTPALFKKYRTAKDYAAADPEELELEIRSSGFYRNKARNIRLAARKIVEEFGGEVPRTVKEMLTLPGVARKTANIVLNDGFGVVVGIAVDTHVKRLAGRLGLTAESNPDRIERDLMNLIPERDWGRVNYLLISHGRAVCRARNPLCPRCPLADLCPYFTKQV